MVCAPPPPPQGLRAAVGSGALAFTLSSPSRRAAGPGKRHPARGVPRAQPRDVRSAGRETWNLTGEALGGPRKRSWRRCSRARSGRRSAIRGAHSGALDRPNPQIPPRAPRYARAPLTLRPTPAAALVQPGRACTEPADRPVQARAGWPCRCRLAPAPAPPGPTPPPSWASAVSSSRRTRSIGVRPPPLASPPPPVRGVALQPYRPPTLDALRPP